MKRKWLLAFLIFFCLALGGFVYFHKFFLPVQLKKIIAAKAQEFLGRPVAIGALDYSFLKGVYIKGIRIAGEGSAPGDFIAIDELSFKLAFPSFFKARGFVIPSIVVERPQISLVRRDQEKFNFTDIIEKWRQRPKTKSSAQIIVGAFVIRDGRLTYTDQRNNVTERLDGLNAQINFSLQRSVKFTVKAVASQTPLFAKGEYALSSRKLQLRFQSRDLDLAKYWPLFFSTEFFDPESGIVPKVDLLVNHEPHFLKLSGDLSLAGLAAGLKEGKSIRGDFAGEGMSVERKEKTWTVKGDINFQHAKIDLAAGRFFKGNGKIFSFLFVRNKNAFEVKGGLDMPNGTAVLGSHTVDVQNIDGNLSVSNGLAETERLSFTALNTPVTLRGKVRDFADPDIDLKYQADAVDLGVLSSLFPGALEKRQLALTGRASLTGHFKGRASLWSDADIQLKAKVKDATLTSGAFNKTLTGLNGDIAISPDKLTCNDLQGRFEKQIFILNGSLVNFDEPDVDLTLASDPLNLTSQLRIRDKNVHIMALHGYYADSSFDLTGNIDTGKRSFPAELQGKFDLNLEDLKDLAPEKNLKAADPRGILSLGAVLKGPLANWTDWELSVNGESSAVSLYGLTADNVQVHYDQRNRFINEGKITGGLYSGGFVFNASGDLNRPDQPLFISLSLQNVELAELKDDLKLKNKALAGTIKANFSGEGKLKAMADLQGKGYAEIIDGHLGQFHLFKGLWETLLIPEFLNVVFTNARADFQVKNRRIATPNLNLKSRQVELNGRGWIDFNQKINFSISPAFSQIALLESTSGLKKVPTSVLTKNSDIVTIKITGTVQNPKYLPITDPAKVIKKTTGAIWQGIEDIFSEIF